MSITKPLTVAIDSSGPALSVGVFDGQHTYTARKTGIKQEQFFLPLLQRVLDKAGAQLADIKHIFFVRGPGRFTGIRISLTFASMMQALNGSNVSSATLFEILHRQAVNCAAFQRWQQQNLSGRIAVVLHAFRGEYFLQFFGPEGTAPMWLSKEQLQAQLVHYPAPLYVVGTDKDGAPLAPCLGASFAYAPAAVNRLQIRTLLEMAADSTYEKNALEPLYLKPARFELGK